MNHTATRGEPKPLRHLFAIANRTVTAELLNLAEPIAAGSTTSAILTEAPF